MYYSYFFFQLRLRRSEGASTCFSGDAGGGRAVSSRAAVLMWRATSTTKSNQRLTGSFGPKHLLIREKQSITKIGSMSLLGLLETKPIYRRERFAVIN
jgi:hypothetical protein